jgi:hypothetical protein
MLCAKQLGTAIRTFPVNETKFWKDLEKIASKMTAKVAIPRGVMIGQG